MWLLSDWWHSLHWPYTQSATVLNGWEKAMGKTSSGTMPLENYPFRKQTDHLSLVFSCFSHLEMFLGSTLKLRNKRPCFKKLFPQITAFPEEKSFVIPSLQYFPAHDVWISFESNFGWQYRANWVCQVLESEVDNRVFFFSSERNWYEWKVLRNVKKRSTSIWTTKSCIWAKKLTRERVRNDLVQI